jgi:hypothetical protein
MVKDGISYEIILIEEDNNSHTYRVISDTYDSTETVYAPNQSTAISRAIDKHVKAYRASKKNRS